MPNHFFKATIKMPNGKTRNLNVAATGFPEDAQPADIEKWLKDRHPEYADAEISVRHLHEGETVNAATAPAAVRGLVGGMAQQQAAQQSAKPAAPVVADKPNGG